MRAALVSSTIWVSSGLGGVGQTVAVGIDALATGLGQLGGAGGGLEHHRRLIWRSLDVGEELLLVDDRLLDTAVGLVEPLQLEVHRRVDLGQRPLLVDLLGPQVVDHVG